MTTRLKIAALIFPGLIVHDLDHAIEKPQEVAHRALLFAEALLLCDFQSGPIEFGRSRYETGHSNQPARPNVPHPENEAIQTAVAKPSGY